MTKEDHIVYWLDTCDDDRITMEALFASGRYTHSLFFGHLYVEKICKALWVKNHVDNTPPRIHNLGKILEGIETGLSDSDLMFLFDLNRYQISGRYPDYVNALKKKTTKEFTAACIQQIILIAECLRRKI